MSEHIHLEQDNMIIASAGTGKTTLMVKTYLQLLEKGIYPHEIITLTFTEKAAFELKERIFQGIEREYCDDPLSKKKLKNEIESSYLGNFHQFCFKIIKKFSLVKNAQKLKILSDFSQDNLLEHCIRTHIKDVLQETNQDFLTLCENFGLSQLKKLFKDLAKTEIIKSKSSIDIPNFQLGEKELISSFEEHLNQIMLRYNKSCLKQDLLDFSQMETYAIDFFHRKDPKAKSFASAIKYILVDEFQDTSPGQIQLIQDLHSMSRKAFYFLVGDPKQSIYGFRGVKQSLINDFKKELTDKGGAVHFQDTNYRSFTPIVQVANRFTKYFYSETPDCSAHLGNNDKSFVKIIEIQKKNKLNAEEHRRAQAQIICQKILESIQSNEAQYKDFAVLFRSSTGSKTLVEEFQKNDIPFSLKGGQKLIEKQNILDLKNLLLCLAYPHEKLFLIGTLKSPAFSWSDDQIFKVFTEENSAWELLQNSQLDFATRAFLQLSELRNYAMYTPLNVLFWEIERNLNWNYLLSLEDPSLNQNINYYQFKALLLDLANQEKIYSFKHFAKNLHRTLSPSINTAPASDQISANNAVALLTIHASKGLEFPQVFLYDINKNSSKPSKTILFSDYGNACKMPESWMSQKLEKTNRFKAIEEKIQTDTLEEEKHLLYVALTRAQQNLYMLKLEQEKTTPNSIQSLLDIILDENVIRENVSTPVTKEAFHRKTHLENNFHKIPSPSAYSVRSVSELETFLECPHLHYLQYKRRIKTDLTLKISNRLSPSQVGTLYHDCLSYLKSNDPNDLMINFNKAWKHNKLDFNLNEKDRMLAELRTYTESQAFLEIVNAQRDYAELPFALLIDDVMIKGQIDRLIQKNNQWSIIDFKYSKTCEKVQAKQYLFQLKTYCLAASQIIQKNVLLAELHTLPNGEITHISFSERELSSHKELLQSLLDQLKLETPSKVKQVPFCKECQFSNKNQLCSVFAQAG